MSQETGSKYILEVDYPSEIQTKLNQWHHTYNIAVIAMNTTLNNQGLQVISLLILRTSKDAS